MSYQVLARKWRPRDFSQMLGQSHVLRALVNALDSDRLHHAYLFTGTRGVGKTSVARVFAKALNCERGVSSKPCGECATCREIEEGRFVDLIEVDAASRTKVDETRELLENVQYAPVRGRYKVYLIDEVHMFSNHSFNALLKTLEEPPPHVKFLLATTDPKRLPITILSRCLQFNLKRLTTEQLQQQLERITAAEDLVAEPAALALLARAADGSVRDALSLLDQAIAYSGGRLVESEVAAMLGTVGTDQVLPLLSALAAGDGRDLITRARALGEFSPDFAQILGELLSVLRRIAVIQTLGDDASQLDEEPGLIELAASIAPEDCQLFYQLGLLGRRDLPLAPEPEIGFEMALLRMLAFRPLEATGEPSTVTTSSRSAAAPTHRTGAAPPAEPALRARSAPLSATPPAPSPPDATPATFDWPELVARLETTGLVRELAKHCALKRYDGRQIELALTPQYENLRSERQIKGLELALRQLLGRDVVVRLSVEQLADAATPAQRSSAADAARQAEAAREIEQDPDVQVLQREFGAVIERVTAK